MTVATLEQTDAIEAAETRRAAFGTPTFADVIHDLGDIPANRILMGRFPATEADVLWMQSHEDRLCELVDGVLAEKPTALRESLLAVLIAHELLKFVLPRRLGMVTGADGMVKILPRQIRIPDVAFFRRDPAAPKLPNLAVPEIAPTLAVEVLSESNTRKEMDRKLREYFAAGTELAWIIDPATRTAEVYTKPRDPIMISIDGALPGEAALPEFSLPMRGLFEELDRQFQA